MVSTTKICLLFMLVAFAAAGCKNGGKGGKKGKGGKDGGKGDKGGKGSEGGEIEKPQGVTDQATIQKILDAHNELRDKVAGGLEELQPGKKCYMRKLVWDACLATLAQKEVDLEVPNHTYTEGCDEKVGQNIAQFWTGIVAKKEWLKKGPVETWSNAVEKWYKEVENMKQEAPMNYPAKENSAGGVTGHYTQVVWSKTSKVGCAYRGRQFQYPAEHETHPSYFANEENYVCNYLEAGNMSINKIKQLAYEAEKSIESCSNVCSKFDVKYKNLCID